MTTKLPNNLLLDKYDVAVRQLAAFDTAQSAIFEKRERLVKAVQEAEKEVLSLATKAAGTTGPKEGEKNTRPLWESANFHVLIQHRQKSAEYKPAFLPKEFLTPTTVKAVFAKQIEAKATELGEKGEQLLAKLKAKKGAYIPAGWQKPVTKIVRGVPDENAEEADQTEED